MDMIHLWVNVYLGEKKKEENNTTVKTKVVFGRTTHPLNSQKKEYNKLQTSNHDNKTQTNESNATTINAHTEAIEDTEIVPFTNVPKYNPDSDRGVNNMKSSSSSSTYSGQGGNRDNWDVGSAPTKNATGKCSKVSGRQIMASKHDFEKAKEKRKRQMNYALEVHGSRRNSVSLHINSITRVVVQSFRKLIDCERCALFLMDHSTNELYFKPVADEYDGIENVKEIRFSASTGVAGWVASRKQALNIKNAYQDSRFNSEIDKQTKFRTRSILCMPVLCSKGNHLFGVIQMVNKKKGDTKVLQSIAKKKKSDNKNHGYEICFEPFSEDDETILERCCLQVSRALEPVIGPYKKDTNPNNKDTSDNQKENHNSIPSSSLNNKYLESKNNERTKLKNDSSTDEDKIDSAPSRRKISNDLSIPRNRRRSSIGSLIQFVSEFGRQSKKAGDMFDNGSSVSEATNNFQFRSPIPGKPQISARHGQLQNDPQRMVAASKRKRMTDYNIQRKESLQISSNKKTQD